MEIESLAFVTSALKEGKWFAPAAFTSRSGRFLATSPNIQPRPIIQNIFEFIL